ASSLPSGEKARVQIDSLAPCGACRGLPVSTSCKRTRPSKPPEAISLPDGAKAKHWTCSSSRHSSLPLATSERRTVESRPAEATTLLSGEKAVATTWSVCRFSVRTTLPLALSQSHNLDPLPGSSAPAIVLPSGERATRLIKGILSAACS